MYGTNPAAGHAATYGWQYWSTNATSSPPDRIKGATYAKSCTSVLLGRRCDGLHGKYRTFEAEPAPDQPSKPRFALYKPWIEWNGSLIVFAKGYGEADAPLRLPSAWAAGLEDLLNLFLSKGYGVAWTSCSENGYAVADCAFLTDQLKSFWEQKFNRGRVVSRTYLAGGSLGGQVVQYLAETAPEGKYKGALASCGVLGGSVRQAKYVFDVRNLFDFYFPNLINYPDNVDVSDTIKLPGRADGYTLTDSTLTPIDPTPSSTMVWGNEPGNLQGFPWSIDATVMQTDSADAYLALVKARQMAAAYGYDSSSTEYATRRIGIRDDGSFLHMSDEAFLREFSDWMRWVMFFHLKGSEDMLYRTGGNPEDNTAVNYSTTVDSSGGTATTPVSIDAPRFHARPNVTYGYLAKNYEPSGKPRTKILSLHNKYDPAVPNWHGDVYETLAGSTGYGASLVRMTANSYGHCNFTEAQITYAFDQLVNWAEKGLAPNPDGLPQ